MREEEEEPLGSPKSYLLAPSCTWLKVLVEILTVAPTSTPLLAPKLFPIFSLPLSLLCHMSFADPLMMHGVMSKQQDHNEYFNENALMMIFLILNSDMINDRFSGQKKH